MTLSTIFNVLFMCKLFHIYYSRMNTTLIVVGEKEPVDMAMIYRQSLFSPMYGALNFKTPAFKANKNRYKMVERSEWHETRFFCLRY